jgi:UDP-GlcNAc:undecaprenyl-phosphate GlcNAc-1-phosphate transferase
MVLFLSFLTSLAVTVMLVPVVGRAARSLGLYAHPSYDRWHQYPVPNVGGVAMLIPLLLVMWLGGLLPELGPLTWACVLMFGVGLADDLHPLRPSTKLVLQMAVAALLLWMLPAIRITGSPVLDLLLGFGWIVAITNAINLLDNIDGLAAGVSAIAGTCFLAVLLLDGAAGPGSLSLGIAAFVGVALGFLLFNFHPASIFMGDGGSHLLGAFLAGATLMSTGTATPRLAPVAAIPVLLLLIPIFDTAFVTLARGLSGRPAFIGGRDHTSHRLVALGIGERRAVLVLYALAITGGVVALGLLMLSPEIAWTLVGAYAVALCLIGVYLGHIQVSRGGAAPPLPTELTMQHRGYEVLLDLLLVSGAYYLAYLARFREPDFTEMLPYFLGTFPLVVGLQMTALWLSGKYRQVWGHLGTAEIFSLVQGSLVGVAASVIAVLYLTRFEGTSRLVFVFDALLAPTLIVSTRVMISRLDEYLRLRRSSGRTALIYGAGHGGALAVRELLQNQEVGLTPAGFIDDNPAKRRMKVEGLAILGGLDDLPALLDRRPGAVSAVVVSMRDLPQERFDRLCQICAARDVAVRRLRFALEDVRQPDQSSRVVKFSRG